MFFKWSGSHVSTWMEVVVELWSLWYPFLSSENHFDWKGLPAFVWWLLCYVDHISECCLQGMGMHHFVLVCFCPQPFPHKSSCDFWWRIVFSTNDSSPRWEARGSETVLIVGLWCQTQWQHQPLIPGSARPLASTLAVQSENSSFCHGCTHFQMFSAHCMAVSVLALQWTMLKGRCSVIGWHGTVFIWLQLVGETSFPWLCRWYSRCSMKVATDVVEMPEH